MSSSAGLIQPNSYVHMLTCHINSRISAVVRYSTRLPQFVHTLSQNWAIITGKNMIFLFSVRCVKLKTEVQLVAIWNH